MAALALSARMVETETSLDDALSRYETNLRQFRVLSAQLRNRNRAAVFDALAGAGVSFVIVNFDRDDDEGPIGDLAVIAADRAAHLPENPITLPIALWSLEQPVTLDLSFPHAIERLAMDYIEQSYGSSSGDFTNLDSIIFNVAARSLALAPRGRGAAGATANPSRE
ncbi:hypothetical protein CFBP4996_26455 (plasmid) [Agrobacterium leguminum]|uniref:DUF6878 family protein n=1 Tax=Agrobacterium leguminum TaxID=2792015 RepID=UPI0010C9EED9|nr:DUF6878 family protein [Agrobacterium leguminum]WFS69537.1 hypothetical protein CFBP4996_26455 [Agrobacterium leguminum]